MSAESTARRKVVKALKPLHAIPVENGWTHPGTPDIAFAWGWIEVKSTNDWPKRETTRVRLDHDLTSHQRLWIKQHIRAGGKAWVMLKVSRDWLLFDGLDAAEHLGRLTKSELFELAIGAWKKCPTYEELIECLKSTT